MIRLKFGKSRIIKFVSETEFYMVLGFLAKSDGTTSLNWEHNEIYGARTGEGRIHCYSNISSFPKVLSDAFTAGTGSIVYRINCNDFLKTLYNDYNYKIGGNQDVKSILEKIPKEFHKDFLKGLNK